MRSKYLVRVPEGKMALIKPIRKQADNIKKNHKVSGFGGMDRSHHTQDRPVADLVNTIIKLSSIKQQNVFTYVEIIIFSSRFLIH